MQAFTSRFQEALQTAQSIAVGKDSNYIEPAHVFLALLRQEGGAAANPSPTKPPKTNAKR